MLHVRMEGFEPPMGVFSRRCLRPVRQPLRHIRKKIRGLPGARADLTARAPVF